MTYDPHDPSVAYWTTRNNTNAFKWPDSKALKDDFPDTAEGQKVVLALLPNFIPYGFGAVPQEGPIEEMGDVFAQMDNGPDQGVDLKPIHDAVLVLVKMENRGKYPVGASRYRCRTSNHNSTKILTVL